jgi:hypothetical protein
MTARIGIRMVLEISTSISRIRQKLLATANLHAHKILYKDLLLSVLRHESRPFSIPFSHSLLLSHYTYTHLIHIHFRAHNLLYHIRFLKLLHPVLIVLFHREQDDPLQSRNIDRWPPASYKRECTAKDRIGEKFAYSFEACKDRKMGQKLRRQVWRLDR